MCGRLVRGTSVEPADHRGSAVAPTAARWSNLSLRVVSSLVLAPLALITAYLGGWSFALFWGVAALIVLSEWMLLVLGRNPLATFPWGRTQLLWIGAGIVYAGMMLLATLHLRADLDYGFVAMIFVFAVVWGSDIVAY